MWCLTLDSLSLNKDNQRYKKIEVGAFYDAAVYLLSVENYFYLIKYINFNKKNRTIKYKEK